MLPHQQTIEEICKNLKTNKEQGLTYQEYEQNLKIFGKNEFTTTQTKSIFIVFLTQFADPLTYMLFGAAGIIFFVGQALDAAIITGILLFNALMGTIQEKRTESILHNLQSFFTCDSLVIRDGKQKIINNQLIVPGDIIILSAGEKVPADARIISANNLTTDESSLTGESTLVEKNEDIIQTEKLAINQQKNILFAGTFIVTGQATAVVFATGNDTQAGKIHNAVQAIETETPLKKDLAHLSSWMLVFIAILCSLLFVIGLLTGKPLVDLLVMITALFICVIPEGLPIVLMIISVSGAYKLAQRNILVKRLKAIEALGRIDLIITDKTGTLTYNQMMVSNVLVAGNMLKVTGAGYFVKGSIENQDQHQKELDEIAITCALLNDTQIEFDKKLQTFKVKGDPTQAAAFIFAQKINAHILDIVKDYTIIYTIPFDAAYKYSAIFCLKDENYFAFVLGAPEVIQPACSKNCNIEKEFNIYLEQGSRVVAVAKKTFNNVIALHQEISAYQEMLQSDLEMLGLLAISDEPRENLKEAIDEMRKAKIQLIMATGDHLQTATLIGQKIGMISNNSDAIASQDFENLSDDEIFNLINHKNFVCARFSPQDKLRLVQIFTKHKKIVATTGDGINDVPALVASDVSIAMGTTGSQLTKQTADLVILNDAFESIMFAIHQGKTVFHAVRRTILYFLTSNATEVFIVFCTLACNIPLPILPSQILLLNLITDGFLDAALAMEPMHTPANHIPTDRRLNIFDNTIMYKTIFLALPASLISLGFFLYLQQYTSIEIARTTTFILLTMFQTFNAFNCRSEGKSILSIGLWTNHWLWLATAGTFLALIAIVYLAPLQYVFKTVAIPPMYWLYTTIIASSVLILEESRKLLIKSK